MNHDTDRNTGRDADWAGGGDGESETPADATAAEGELRYRGARWPIAGRTLQLMLWLAARQQRINAVASERGQLWITWKGSGPHSIDGEVKTRLSGE